MGIFANGEKFDWDHELFCFVHVPKCGGTSIHELFKKGFLGNYEIFVGKPYEEDFLKSLKGGGGHQLNGRSPLFTVKGKSFKRLCIVRHPVDRVISLYEHVMRFPAAHPLAKYQANTNFQGYNVIDFAKLCISKDVPEVMNYCSYFILGSWEQPDSLEKIIYKLHQDFKFFATLEFMDILQNELCQYLSIDCEAKEVIHTNQSVNKTKISSEERKELSVILSQSASYDFELYDYILKYNCKEIQSQFKELKKGLQKSSNA